MLQTQLEHSSQRAGDLERRLALLRDDHDRVLARARELDAAVVAARRGAHEDLAATRTRLEAARGDDAEAARRAAEAAAAEVARWKDEAALLRECGVRCAWACQRLLAT